MKIIHCADIHLDTPFGNMFNIEKSAVRKQEILLSFVRLIKYAGDIKTRFIMISGDMIDPGNIQQKTMDTIYDCIIRNPDIDFLVLPGTEQESTYLEHMSSRPGNLKIFDEQNRSFRYGQCFVCAAASPDGLPELGESDINIVMHYGTVDPDEWKDRRIDYLALGGQHTFSSGETDQRGVYCYPGSLEGLSFDEVGEKGFIELDAQDDRLETAFIRSGKRKVYNVSVDISKAPDNDAISDLIREKVTGIDGSSLVKVSLTGTVSIDSRRDVKEIEKEFSKCFFGFVIDEKDIELSIDSSQYRFDKTLKGEFIRTVLAGNESNEEKKDIIETGLRALSGGDI